MNMALALNKLKNFFEEEKIPYMVFGGLATGVYGYERMTYDIDIKILHEVTEDSLNELVIRLSTVSNILPKDPVSFIRKTMVLPIEVEAVKADIVFTGLEYEIESINRAQQKELFGIMVKVIAVEDLIVQKSISERDKDWQDIENLINFNASLDWQYLLRQINIFSEILDKPEMLTKIGKMRK
ncbi:MAG: nucleotidyltransferase [Candidatus Delongbacteria bacterium]|nr:nucleotidyltransferase [Candidatus Delongbacteria bacterium]